MIVITMPDNYVKRVDVAKTLLDYDAITDNGLRILQDMPAANVIEKEIGMTAIDYLRTARRMCHTYMHDHCEGCPFWITKNCLGLPGDMTEWQMVTTVKKWGEEHREN